MKNVWLFCRDPGGTNGLLSVYRELVKREVADLMVFANGFAATEEIKAADSPRIKCDSAEEVLQGRPLPDLIVTTMDSEGAIGHKTVLLLHERGISIPTVALSDYWTSAALITWGRLRPNFITTNDEVGRRIILRAWPDMNPDNVIITGYPAFDSYQGIEGRISTMRHEMRDRFGIKKSQFAPLYLADLRGGVEGFRLFLNALEKTCLTQQTVVLLRRHPRMAIETVDQYRELESMLVSDENPPIILVEQPLTMMEAIATTDVVISAYSTALGEAAAMRVPAINWAFQTVQEIYNQRTAGISPQFPLVSLNCCAEATNDSELAVLLTSAHSGVLVKQLRNGQEQAFRVDGKNATRVTDLIQSLL